MKYILFDTSSDIYLLSNTVPEDADRFDIIDLEAKKCIAGPSGEHDLEEYSEPESEAETQEIPLKEEREFDPEEKFAVKIED